MTGKLVFMIYLIPCYIPLLYFTILKLEDIGKPEGKKVYTKDKFSYFKVVGLCIAPIFNILLTILVIFNINKLIDGFPVKKLELIKN